MANPTPEIWDDTVSATEELRTELKAHGITLPELSINVPTLIAGLPLVNLGSIDVTTARRLAAILRDVR